MTFHIGRYTSTTTNTKSYPTGDRTEKQVTTTEHATVYGTEDVLTWLATQLQNEGIGFSKLKTCIKFTTSTEKYEDIERQLLQGFPQKL
jgi:hypothetical protein